MKRLIILTLLLTTPLFTDAMADDRLFAVKVEEYTNNLRTSLHMQTLQKDACLTKAAIAKAKDVATRGYVSHAPAGERWSKFVDLCQWWEVSENIAFHYDDPFTAYVGLKESPRHLLAMLVRYYSRIGIGTYEKYPGRWIAVMYVAQ